VPRENCAFGPGRVNLIGEHTDYNQGLALPFAIADGVTVRAREHAPGSPVAGIIEAHAEDLGERDSFSVADVAPVEGWRAFVRGVAAELTLAGVPVPGATLRIAGGIARGAGLSSSAALEVALCLALADLAGHDEMDLVQIAVLCARVENRWVGAQTGVLDQLASLFGARESALLIDFRTLHVEHVPLHLDGWSLAVMDSGERHSNVSSGYNQRRRECARACELLGLPSLREASERDLARLPEPERSRAAHVIGENERVLAAVGALRAGDMAALGALLDRSHASERDLFDVSTPTVERTVQDMLAAGAAGARLMGGGFGGSVLGLFPPGRQPPAGAREVTPGPGARLLES
jgi:galactokinase